MIALKARYNNIKNWKVRPWRNIKQIVVKNGKLPPSITFALLNQNSNKMINLILLCFLAFVWFLMMWRNKNPIKCQYLIWHCLYCQLRNCIDIELKHRRILMMESVSHIICIYRFCSILRLNQILNILKIIWINMLCESFITRQIYVNLLFGWQHFSVFLSTINQ